MPKKAKTTHEAQPMQTSTSQPVHALLSNLSLSSQPTQPSVSLPLTANQFIHPITGINVKDKVPCKEEKSSSKEVTLSMLGCTISRLVHFVTYQLFWNLMTED